MSDTPKIPDDLPENTAEVVAEVATPKTAAQGGSHSNFMVDFGPVLVFVLLYNYLRRSDPDGAIYTAAIVFSVVAVLALAYSRIKLGKFSTMLMVTTAIIILTVALSVLFDNPIFFYMKPTVVNIIFGILTIGGALIGKNVLKMMMGSAFEMPTKAWNTLAIRWGLFFFVLAIINEVVWRNFSEAFWANFKLFGFFPITIIFTLSQMPFILKNGKIKTEES